MPTYDYYCAANDRTIEVSHSISERLTTWGAVCERAAISPDGTAAEAPVTRLISRAGVVHSGVLRNLEQPPCQTGAPCCGAGQCGFA